MGNFIVLDLEGQGETEVSVNALLDKPKPEWKKVKILLGKIGEKKEGKWKKKKIMERC